LRNQQGNNGGNNRRNNRNQNNKSRRRSGNSGQGGGGGRNQFDSQGPSGKIRGNAQQLYDKFTAYAKDELSSGEYIEAERYYQFAEHYYRLGGPFDQKPQQNQKDNDSSEVSAHQADKDESATEARADKTDTKEKEPPKSSRGPNSNKAPKSGKPEKSAKKPNKKAVDEQVEEAFSEANLPSFLNASASRNEDEDSEPVAV